MSAFLMMARPSHSGRDLPLLLDSQHLCELLGLSQRTVRSWVAQGRLPAPFARNRWRRDEVLAWIEAGQPDRRSWEASRRRRQ